MTRPASLLAAALCTAPLLHAAPAAKSEPVTFNRDIAPIIWQSCTQCHREGGAAPFPLMRYAEVKKRGKQIDDVTSRRLMPPWLPGRGGPPFVREDMHRLSMSKLALLSRWVKQGALEGDAKDLPAAPTWSTAWQLGEPDFIAEMPEDFVLPAAGRDVYRNFILPAALPKGRWVRAAEIRPGNAAVVHHALVFVDFEGRAHAAEAKAREADPRHLAGIPGMNPGPGIGAPMGAFVSWQPGRIARPEGAGIAWWLERGKDLVIQLHMRPSGKREKVRAQIGLYFTDEPPQHAAFTMLLRSTGIDIPAGEKSHAIESSYRTTVPTRIHSILPHAHYLCREMNAWAELPDGTEQQLLYIPQWDFNWQRDYRFLKPVELPAGTTLRMRYLYDNSAANPRNPDRPPKRRQYGLETTDEMAELWLQVTTATAADYRTLATDFRRDYSVPDAIALAENLLLRSPGDADLITDRGTALVVAGRVEEGKAELLRAATLDPQLAQPHATLGLLFAQEKRIDDATRHLETAVKLAPDDFRSWNALGMMSLQRGERQRAVEHFERALALQPEDPLIQRNLKAAKASGTEG